MLIYGENLIFNLNFLTYNGETTHNSLTVMYNSTTLSQLYKIA